MTRGEIVYPIFLQSSQYATDKFWEKIFEDLAYGVTPYGVYVTNTTINCKTKTGNMTSVIINFKNPKTTYTEVYEMFYNVLGIMSPCERKSNCDKLNEKNVSIETWSDIRKKNVKEILIEIFSIQMKKLYKLSVNQTRFLISIIYTSLLFKTLDTSDIKMINGMIESINGIDFDDGKINIDLDIYDIDTYEVNVSNQETNKMFDEWEKYINSIRKKIDLSS